MLAKSEEPDQTPHSAASDLVLHCMHMSHKKDTMLIWVNVKQSAQFSLLRLLETRKGMKTLLHNHDR